MRLILFLLLLIQIGCATKYLIPGNRFMTPESQGGVFNGQFEFMQTSANQLTADLSNASIHDGVNYSEISRSGFLFSSSFFEQLDLFWTHTGGANSLIGAKFQFLGASRLAKGTGHKMAFSLAIGGNDYDTEGSTAVDFELKGNELQLLYGYRFTENFLAYSTLSFASYNFSGVVSSNDPTINGLEPAYETKVRAIYGGLEGSFGSFFGKLECGYQQLKTTDTKDIAHFIFGYSLGLSW